jgi:acyl-CoA synthetase (AMP-forming)/AMP-acid ligase II
VTSTDTALDQFPAPPDPATLGALLLSTAERFADRTLVVVDDDRLGYAEAEARSRSLAKGLLAEGISKGSHVGILMPNSIDWVVTWFALARIGAVGVPLNTFSRAGELAWLIRHADVSHLLAWTTFLNHDYQARLEEALPGLSDASADEDLFLVDAPLLRGVHLLGDTDRRWARGDLAAIETTGSVAGIDDELVDAVGASVSPGDPAVIIYTSGSTADPKGCIHANGAVVRQSLEVTRSYLVTSGDVMFSSMPFFWIGGLVTALHACQHHGATLVTQPAFDAGSALELIEREQATIAQGWPQQGTSLAEHPSFPDRDVSSVRRTSMPAFVAAERRPPAVRSDSLGMTETCGSHANFDPYVELPEARRGTYGRAVAGIEHRIIDPETGEPQPAGAPGEILVRGSSVMLGLQKVERLQVFDADGWLHTGDGGWLDEDGWLYYTGRLGDMIKTGGGTNIAPAEVERALVQLPGVLEAYVAGAPTDDGMQVVTAAVIPQAGHELDPDEVRAALRTALSAYKVPRLVWVCQKVDLPFTTTGKLRRGELAEQMALRLATHVSG